MLGKGGMAQLMQQAQQMQQRMQAVQASVAKMEVTGESGAGLVKITLNGAYQCRSIVIDQSLLSDDKEMLEDLISAAFNDTVRRVKTLEEQQMAQVSGDLPLPPGFKLPR